MIKPAKHGRDHLAGGEDPVPFGAEWIVATPSGGGDITVTTTMEMPYADFGVYTNSPATFGWDPDDPAGILIRRTGFYLCGVTINTYSSYISTPKIIYQSAQPLSSGPGLFGNELGDGAFCIGNGMGASGISQAPGPGGEGKSRIAHYAHIIFGETGGPGSLDGDPWRHAVVLQHLGSNWVVGNIPSRTSIVRVGNYDWEDVVNNNVVGF